jgi:hydrogenase nickel incorporation protein HypB
MCTTCGCGSDELHIEGKPIDAATHSHTHADGGERSYVHAAHATHGSVAEALRAMHASRVAPNRIVQIEEDILAKNDAFARENRRYFADRGILALNVMSSPGSGKTSLLVRTIDAWQKRAPIAVIEGDQRTSRDADRIRATGARAVQINTGKGCHLDAHMVGHALRDLKPSDDSVLLIENVGNLVCPASFDLGEANRVVILSVTEGEDKPLKYPDMFRAADLMLINKVDLLPYVDFNVAEAIEFAQRVRPGLEAIAVSARTDEGLDAWLAWIERGLKEARAQ